MPDDPNKKGQDRKFVSKQTHEQSYQKRKDSKANNDTNSKKKSDNSNRESGKQQS